MMNTDRDAHEGLWVLINNLRMMESTKDIADLIQHLQLRPGDHTQRIKDER